MADKPIIFSAPMVRALLDGRKTQTRRIAAPFAYDRSPLHPGMKGYRPAPINLWQVDHGGPYFLPRYSVGDRLYVREAVCWVSRLGWRYRADDDDLSDNREAGEVGRWHPSIHMPRLASRITLTVTDVRVQRLQEISEADAWAEGCKPGELNDRGEPFPAEEPHPKCGWVGWDYARDWYADLWDSLHGPGAWDLNPWVAAYTFTVHRCNIDCLPAPLGVEQRPQVNRNIRRKTTSMAAKGGA